MRKSWKRKILSLILSAAVIASLGAGASLPVKAAEQDIIILYTNDAHCGVEDNIGYAGLALYKQEMEQITPYVSLVDAGDAIQGAPIGTLSQGSYLTAIMNYLEYDFAIPGNHEFDYGAEWFIGLNDHLDCGYYSCNFENIIKEEPVFEPYKIISYGDTDVAYVGVSTPESFTKSTPVYFQDEQGYYIYGFCEDGSGEKLYKRVQESVDAARKDGADYVILVGHLGNAGVTTRWTSASVIANTNGIDACIDGHSHEEVAQLLIPNKDGENVVLTQTGTKLANIGKMTIAPDGTISTELVSEVPEAEGCLITQDGKAVDFGTQLYIDAIKSQYHEILEEVIGTTPALLTTKDAETGERKVRSGETNLGDLAADAYRNVLGADIGLSNGGGIRADIEAGDITYNDTLTVFPYGNMGCVVEATGQQILDCLEMGARFAPDECGGFEQVSGLTYTVDTSVPSSVVMDDKGNFVNVAGAYRVCDVMVGGEPLDLDKIYTVASHNYLLKNGGDGMTMFMECNILRDEVLADVDILSQYIKSMGGTVSSEYADPNGQGRIVIK